MLFYMDGKTFLQTYLEREDDWRILEAYYVIMSDSIRVSNQDKYGTIIYAPKWFYPAAEVLFASEWEEYKQAYFHQLEDARDMLAEIVYGSLTKQHNVIFLYAQKEQKEKFPKVLAQYIMREFKYPIYDYKKYINYKCKICDYDPQEVYDIVKPITDRIMERMKKMQSMDSNYLLHKREKIKKWPKKKLKKKLEEYGYYVEKESKHEMLALYLSLKEGLPIMD